MKNNHFKLTRSLALSCLSISPLTTQASGYRLPELSIAGLGTANALVADTKSPGALPYNPAAMTFHSGRNLVVGVMNIHPDTETTPAGGTTTKSQAEANVQTPSIFFLDHINQNVAWGIAVNAPFGLATKWPDETFPAYAGAADPFEPEQSKLEMLNINPNVAYQVGGDTSVAVGIDYYVVKKLTFNTQAIAIEGDGRNLGWNLGIQHVHDAWSFGLTYRSSVLVDLEGSVDATAIGSTKTAAEAKLEFPSLLQAGARYQINKDWAAEFDIERTGWSSFDTVEIHHSSLGIPNPINGKHQWSNTTTYRVGGQFHASPVTEIRFGYARDATPQNEKHFSARVPDNDRQTFSTGMAYSLGHATSRLRVEAGYMYVRLDDRTVAATMFENGTYTSSAHLFGIGFSRQF